MSISSPARARPDLIRLQRLYDKGDYRKALIQAQRAIRQLPLHGDLYALAASCARNLGDVAHAEKLYRRAIERVGPGCDYQMHLGNMLCDNGSYEAAAAEYRDVLAARPNHTAAYHGVGAALLGLAKPREALTYLSVAVERSPNNAQFVSTLGRAFEWMGLYQEASDCFAIAAKLEDTSAVYRVAQARTLHLTGQSEAALSVLDAARTIWPDDARILDAASVVYSSLGQTEIASTLRQTALARQPENCAGLMNFAHLHDMTREPDAHHHMNRMLQRATKDEERMYLHFALAKTCEDHKDYAAAYDHLTRANALRRAQLRYDPAQDQSFFHTIKATFKDAAAAPRTDAPTGPIPIFIVGMPRSGTSLTEAILARHPEVTACGELEALTSIIRRGHVNQVPQGPTAKALRADYLSLLPENAHGAHFVTDKMPVNFRLIGHIACAIPEARILDVRRDPKATCWSNFRHFYASTGNGFSYDPADLVTYFKAYSDLMNFWHARFPGRIQTLNYEALVQDPAEQSRQLLAGLGLAWDDACLTPEDSDHAVRTASARQVRQKIYTGSAEGWRRYEPWAGEWLAQVAD